MTFSFSTGVFCADLESALSAAQSLISGTTKSAGEIQSEAQQQKQQAEEALAKATAAAAAPDATDVIKKQLLAHQNQSI